MEDREKADNELHFALHGYLKTYLQSVYKRNHVEAFLEKDINATTNKRDGLVKEIEKCIKELGYRKPGELLSDIEKNLRMYFVSDDQGNIAVTKSWRILKAQLDKRGE